jgi:tape measure domain-containing protein
LGYVQGQSTIFEQKDDAFKSYYQELYDDVLSTQNKALTSGSSTASNRERNMISFSTLLGGDKNAGTYLGDVTKFAAATPFEYDDLTNISKTLLAYKYKQDEIIPLLTKVGDTGSALDMSTEDMTWVATALGRMKSTGKTTLEYLNPLLERGIPVWDYLAKASGKTNKEVQEMVSKGLLPGEKAAEAIADYMGHDFAGNMGKQAQTYSGLISTLEDANNELNNAMGEGYNSTRKSGLKDQIDWLSGESGEEMQDAYNKIGQWKASLENLQEQYRRDALNSVMSGTVSTEFSPETQDKLATMYEEYTKYAADGSEKAGAQMGALLAEAQAIAQNEYNASEGAQLALESNKTLAENIKNDTAGQEAYWDAGYTMGQQFTLGLKSAMTLDNVIAPTTKETGFDLSMPKSPDDWLTKLGKEIVTVGELPVKAMDWLTNLGSSHAYGLNYVPYDNYPALLHEGERVLTASENRSRGANTPVTITGNNFVVRSEDDIKSIGAEVARQVAQQISQAYQLAP